MKSLFLRSAFLLVIAVLCLATSPLKAQRPGGGGGRGGFGGGGPGGGRGGFGGGGSLGILQRDTNAEELKLTDDQKAKIKELSEKQREDTRMRDIFGKMRDASDEERTALQAETVKLTESIRLQTDADLKQILMPEQFTRYRQLALQQRGVSAIGDSDVSGELKLSEEQLAKLKAISEESDKRRNELFAKMREQGFGGGGGEDMRTKMEEMRKEFEEKRIAILTDAQRKQWEVLRGPEPVAEDDAAKKDTAKADSSNDAGSRFARRSVPVADADAVVSQSVGDGRPARVAITSFGKAADVALAVKAASITSEKPADGDAAKNAGPQEKVDLKVEKLTFNFRFAPWADVLKTFAELGGLTLDLNVIPPGTFNYFDEKEYTPTEALDVINGYLLQKGFVLVRRDQFLVVLNVDDGIPPNLVPNIPLEELAQHGKNELLNIILPVEGITAEEAAEEAKELIGPQGSVVALKKLTAISVTDIGTNLRRIQRLLSGVTANPGDLAFRSFDLKHIEATDAERTVRELFGLPRGIESVSDGVGSRSRGSDQRDPRDDRSRTPLPTAAKAKIQVAIDERTNRLLITAGVAEMKIVEDTLKAIDVAEEVGTTGTRKPRNRDPYLHVYSVKTADPMEVAKTLGVLYPGCVVNEDGRARRLHIHGTPAQHEQIERTIKQLDGEGGGSTSVAVVPTGRIDALTATTTLHMLFVGEKDAAPSIQPHPAGSALIVRGTADQVNQIKMLLTQMDPNALAGERQKGTLRSIPLGGRDADEFTAMIKQFWSTRHSNPIIVVPSQTKPVNDLRVPSATAPTEEKPRSRVGRTSSSAAETAPKESAPRNAAPKAASPKSDPDSAPAPTRKVRAAKADESKRQTIKSKPLPANDAKLDARAALDLSATPARVIFTSQTTDNTQAPPSLPRWSQAFARGVSSLDCVDAVVQKPEIHRDKLGGVVLVSDRPNDQPTAADNPTPKKKNKAALAKPNARKKKKPAAVESAKEAITDNQPQTERSRSKAADAGDVRQSEQKTAEGGGSPILIVPNGGNLILKSDDEAALDELESLIEMMQEAAPSKSRWTVFYLRSADASETAAMLERLFPTSSVSSSNASSSGMLGELTSGMGSMGRTLMNATGLNTLGTSSLALRIVPEVRSNALYVSGPAHQVSEVEMMLKVLDASELPDQLRDRAPHFIEVEHAEVEEVAAIVRDVYKDDLTPEGQQPGQAPNPFAMLMGQGGGSNRNNRGGQQPQRTIKLTLGVDTRTNTLIVSASESLFRQIEALVISLDDAARDAKRTVRVVDLGGANPALVQQTLGAMYSKVKVSSSGKSKSSGTSSSSGSSSSPSAPPSFGASPFLPFGVSNGSSNSGGSSSDAARSFFQQRMRERMGGSGGGPGR
ncbi:MAG: hypothetical protein NT013_13980 [Planctomycetia bacterium]|nr:hypothetical protein [Planctomycetia bacterium]